MKKIAKFFPVSAKKNLLRWFFIVLFSIQITFCVFPFASGAEGLNVIVPLFYPFCLFYGLIKWGTVGVLMIFLALANLASLILALYDVAKGIWKWVTLSPVVFYIGNIILTIYLICSGDHSHSIFFLLLSVLENLFVITLLCFTWKTNRMK
ncbi:MAG: hypothetical protein J6A68_04155 [Oscillospiraceae bacterium]|nr:hypothetical protein [Oscillospiraceae bacterium]